MTIYDSLMIVVFFVIFSFLIGGIAKNLETIETLKKGKELCKTMLLKIIPMPDENGDSDPDIPVIVHSVVLR